MKKLIIFFIFILVIVFFINTSEKDKKIIENYYFYISNIETLKQAYEISPKKVDYDTFYSWYKDVKRIILSNITLKEDGSYQLIVTVINNVPGQEYKIDCSVYDVSMFIKNNKIEKSTSKQIYDYVFFEKKINNKYIVKISDDTKNNQFIFKIINNENNNVIGLNKYEYFDEWRYEFNFYKMINDFIIFEIKGFEFLTYDFFDIKNNKVYRPEFWNLLFSKDNNVVISYSNDNYISLLQGLYVLIYKNKYINNLITVKGVEEPKIELIGNEYWITYKEFQNGDETKFLGDKKINITKLIH